MVYVLKMTVYVVKLTVYVYDRTSTPWRLNFVPSRHFWRHLFCHQSVSFMNLKHSKHTYSLDNLFETRTTPANLSWTALSRVARTVEHTCTLDFQDLPPKLANTLYWWICRCLNPQNNLPATNLSRTNISHKSLGKNTCTRLTSCYLTNESVMNQLSGNSVERINLSRTTQNKHQRKEKWKKKKTSSTLTDRAKLLYILLLNLQKRKWLYIQKYICKHCDMRRGGGLGSNTIFKNLMSPTPRRKWYLTTGRRAHSMILDPIPQPLPVHFFGSRPQPPTSRYACIILQTLLPWIYAPIIHKYTNICAYTRTYTYVLCTYIWI